MCLIGYLIMKFDPYLLQLGRGAVSEDALSHVKSQERLWSDPTNWQDQELWSSMFAKNTQDLWDNVILPRIKDYLKGDVLEDAPGHGRVTNFLAKHLNILDSLELVDQSEHCIEYCRERFGRNLKYHVNNGMSLNMIENNSKDFVFSWDSFVHMDREVINLYLAGFSNVLKKGGHGFIHHSYFYGDKNPEKNKAGRSNMDIDEFADLLVKNNLKKVKQEIFTHKDTIKEDPSIINDCFTTFAKT